MTGHVYLECYVGGSRAPRRFDLQWLPATIGRHPDCAVQINAARISRMHAEIGRDDGDGRQLWIRDLGSTNGTYLNGARIDDTVGLQSGDVIHVGDHEFRLIEEIDPEELSPDVMTRIGLDTLPHEFPIRVREFNELIDGNLVTGYWQPITDNSGNLYGYELLGRGCHPSLNAAPGELFAIASTLDEEVRLSELLRRRCFEAASDTAIEMPLFFNTHPAECRDPRRLIDELRHLRARHRSLELVFEVHERAVTDLRMMAEIRAELATMDIGLAYDDFGAGQARLLELVEVPPDYLKFDLALVSGIAEPGSPKYRLLSVLNSMIRDMGIRTLAEGVEDEPTARACAEMGIDLLQGYLFGRPAPIGPEPQRS